MASAESHLPTHRLDQFCRIVSHRILEHYLNVLDVVDFRGRIAVNHYKIGLLTGRERANVLCFPKKLCSVQNPEAHRAALKKALIIGAAIGIPANVASTYVMHITGGQMRSGPPGGLQLFCFFLFMLGRPALSMCYASAVVLLFLDTTWRPRLKPFSVIGRTALSNYLFQTIFCTTIFFGYGGGLFAKVHLAWLMVLSVAVYALEVLLSRWWVAHYRFGPAEWAWRSLTYGRLQPMKI